MCEVTEGDIIADAIKLNDGPLQERIGQPGILLAALETIWGHGGADESHGSVDEGLHYFRVARWIVTTDSAGFMGIDTFDTVELAERAFAATLSLEEENMHGDAADMMGEPW